MKLKEKNKKFKIDHNNCQMNKSTNSLKKLSLTGAVLLFFTVLILHSAEAQQGIHTSGGNATGMGGSVSFSAGQLFFHTQTGADGSVAQGVQQPYEISVVTETKDAGDITLSVRAYPNPVDNLLLLKVESDKWLALSFQIYDLQGKVLKTDKILTTETQIDMSAYIPASYLLKVFSENKPVKEFKIIKN